MNILFYLASVKLEIFRKLSQDSIDFTKFECFCKTIIIQQQWHSKELSTLTLRNAKDVLYVSKTVRPKAFSYPRWSTARVIIMPKWSARHASVAATAQSFVLIR